MTTSVIELLKVPPNLWIRSLVPLKNGEFLAVPDFTHHPCYKYCMRTDEWIPLLSTRWYESKQIKDAVFTGDKEVLIWTDDALFSVDIIIGTIQFVWKRPAIHGALQDMFLIGDHLHILTPKAQGDLHNIISKTNGNSIGNAVTINRNSDCFEFAKYFQSRDSIVVSGRDSLHNPMLTISEYSVSTNQWVNWKWVEALNFMVGEYPMYVVTCDERYILILNLGNNRSDEIVAVGDLKLKTITRISFRSPIYPIFRAYLLRDQEGDELLTFGFVRRTFKSPGFQNMQRLPHYLIQLIGKWIHNEYLHLMDHQDDTTSGEANHSKINVDDILNLAFGT